MLSCEYAHFVPLSRRRLTRHHYLLKLSIIFRLAEAAFKAQDEAAQLREQLEEVQKRQERGADKNSEEPSWGGALSLCGAVGGGSVVVEGIEASPRLDGKPALDNGAPVARATLEGAAGRGGDFAGDRLMELEVQKWECELGKEEAEKEAREANLALDEARAEVSFAVELVADWKGKTDLSCRDRRFW